MLYFLHARPTVSPTGMFVDTHTLTSSIIQVQLYNFNKSFTIHLINHLYDVALYNGSSQSDPSYDLNISYL